MQTLKNDIFYQDNFLPNFYFESLKEELIKESFPWFFKKEIAGYSERVENNIIYLKNQYGFYHTLFHEDFGWSNNSILFKPVISAIQENFNLKIEFLLRMRVGLLTNVGEVGSHYPHIDYDVPHKTVLLYMDNSDGPTIFYDAHYQDESDISKMSSFAMSEPIANRAIMFNGLRYHSSSSPVNFEKRLAININFICGQ